MTSPNHLAERHRSGARDGSSCHECAWHLFLHRCGSHLACVDRLPRQFLGAGRRRGECAVAGSARNHSDPFAGELRCRLRPGGRDSARHHCSGRRARGSRISRGRNDAHRRCPSERNRAARTGSFPQYPCAGLFQAGGYDGRQSGLPLTARHCAPQVGARIMSSIVPSRCRQVWRCRAPLRAASISSASRVDSDCCNRSPRSSRRFME